MTLGTQTWRYTIVLTDPIPQPYPTLLRDSHFQYTPIDLQPYVCLRSVFADITNHHSENATATFATQGLICIPQIQPFKCSDTARHARCRLTNEDYCWNITTDTFPNYFNFTFQADFSNFSDNDDMQKVFIGTINYTIINGTDTDFEDLTLKETTDAVHKQNFI